MGQKIIQGDLSVRGELLARDGIYCGEDDNIFIGTTEITINGSRVITEDTMPDISGGSGEAIDVTIDENSTLQDIVNALIAAGKDYTKANLININNSCAWITIFSGETSGTYFVYNLETGFNHRSGGLFAQENAYNLLNGSLIYQDNDGNTIDTGWYDVDVALSEIHRTLGNKMPYLFVNCDSSTRLSVVGEAMTTNGVLGKAVVVSVSGFCNGTYILTLSSQGGTRYSMQGIDLGTFSSIYSSSVDTSTIYLKDFVDNTCEGWVSYQKATDTSLNTTSKAIIGAINELDDRLDALTGDYSRGLEYTLNEDEASYTVTGIGTCTDIDIVIPMMYNGLPVTKIGTSVFKANTNITSVKLPDTIQSIEDYAFQSCTSLVSINIPEGVTRIGVIAFDGCTSLTGITIPSSVITVGQQAFSGCTSLVNVTLLNSTLGSSEFSRCTSLKHITIPKSITSIPGSVFSNCTALTNVEIPKGVTIISGQAFEGCTSLKTITIPNSVTTVLYNVFKDCSALTIYCEVEALPNTWNGNWNPSSCPVVWGCSLDIPAINDALNAKADRDEIIAYIDNTILNGAW